MLRIKAAGDGREWKEGAAVLGAKQRIVALEERRHINVVTDRHVGVRKEIKFIPKPRHAFLIYACVYVFGNGISF